MAPVRRKPVELSEKDKLFARLLHLGRPVPQAYEDAGFKPDRGNCYRLRRSARLQRYLASLEARVAKNHDVTVDSLIEELEDARKNAQRVNQPGSEVSAIMGKARLAGLIIDKREVKTNDIDRMDIPQLAQLLRDALGDKADIILTELGVVPPAPTSDTVN